MQEAEPSCGTKPPQAREGNKASGRRHAQSPVGTPRGALSLSLSLLLLLLSSLAVLERNGDGCAPFLPALACSSVVVDLGLSIVECVGQGQSYCSSRGKLRASRPWRESLHGKSCDVMDNLDNNSSGAMRTQLLQGTVSHPGPVPLR